MLTRDTPFLGNRFSGSENAARDKALPALVLAGRDEDYIAFGDVFAAVHRLRGERERLRPWISRFGFNPKIMLLISHH